MCKFDRDILLEALSTLLGATMKQYSGSKGSLKSNAELHVYNFINTAVLGYGYGDLVSALQPMNSRRELFVNMDEFFDPQFDCDFRHLTDFSVCTRGGEPYKRPSGWYRFALKVKNKYPDGNTWLGVDGWRGPSVAGEWPVSYHGTTVESAMGIVKTPYKAGLRKQYGRGIYCTYDLEQASEYSREFTSKKNGKRYRVIMQNRINPRMRQVFSRKDYWLIPIPDGICSYEEREIVVKAIRPYGILIKEV